ncbi:MBOAT family O-acyltransferase [Rhodohalobacter sulfatireducens]|uniref:MBOAT family protein n=1 Tax=Rhodohalobacter sulfatireducens TaxID=2911366 RepID=A0ABS9K8S3_9BACT|nr:MBOAT family O-acyltransferase [Rhodohalobacter sulfatireducens]MCG2587213.1 MBOAT family protein [Rhodohalobacter sulfatireducens]
MKSPKKTLNLDEYIIRRTGVPMGASGSLRKMLRRSLGAKSPKLFWQYWNPIFGYFLGKYIHSPLKKFLPAPLAILLTFLFSGLVHDMATIAVRGTTRFLFTTWFFFLGMGLILIEMGNISWADKSRSTRIISNLSYLILCFLIAYGVVVLIADL